MITFKIDNSDMYKSYSAVLESFDIGMPEPQIIKVSVPGRSGDLDMSEALTGVIHYGNRTIQLDIGLTGTDSQLEQKRIKLFQLLNGMKRKLRFSHQEGYYYGRGYVDSYERERNHLTVHVIFDCEPYRYDEEETVYIKELSSTTIGQSCGCTMMPVSPTIVTTGETTIRFSNKSYVVKAGTHRLGFIFKQGSNMVYLSGVGTATIKYRNGVL